MKVLILNFKLFILSLFIFLAQSANAATPVPANCDWTKGGYLAGPTAGSPIASFANCTVSNSMLSLQPQPAYNNMTNNYWNLNSADMTNATFNSGYWNGVSVNSAKLNGTNFNNMIFVNVDFSKSSMVSTTFTNCSFVNVKFQGTLIDGVKFANTLGSTQGVYQPAASIAATTTPWNPGNAFVNVDFTGATFNINTSVIYGVSGNIIAPGLNANLNITTSTLKNSKFTGTTFTSAVNSIFSNDFSYSDFSQTQFPGQVRQYNLKNNNFTGTNFARAIVNNAQFDGSNFKGAYLGVTRPGAIYPSWTVTNSTFVGSIDMLGNTCTTQTFINGDSNNHC
jgi:uncharacterized protein YjbI with pentapeptide repeats